MSFLAGGLVDRLFGLGVVQCWTSAGWAGVDQVGGPSGSPNDDCLRLWGCLRHVGAVEEIGGHGQLRSTVVVEGGRREPKETKDLGEEEEEEEEKKNSGESLHL